MATSTATALHLGDTAGTPAGGRDVAAALATFAASNPKLSHLAAGPGRSVPGLIAMTNFFLDGGCAVQRPGAGAPRLTVVGHGHDGHGAPSTPVHGSGYAAVAPMTPAAPIDPWALPAAQRESLPLKPIAVSGSGNPSPFDGFFGV